MSKDLVSLLEKHAGGRGVRHSGYGLEAEAARDVGEKEEPRDLGELPAVGRKGSRNHAVTVLLSSAERHELVEAASHYGEMGVSPFARDVLLHAVRGEYEALTGMFSRHLPAALRAVVVDFRGMGWRVTAEELLEAVKRVRAERGSLLKEGPGDPGAPPAPEGDLADAGPR